MSRLSFRHTITSLVVACKVCCLKLCELLQATGQPEGAPSAQSSFQHPHAAGSLQSTQPSVSQALAAAHQAPSTPQDPRLHRMPSPQGAAAASKDPKAEAGGSQTDVMTTSAGQQASDE